MKINSQVPGSSVARSVLMLACLALVAFGCDRPVQPVSAAAAIQTQELKPLAGIAGRSGGLVRRDAVVQIDKAGIERRTDTVSFNWASRSGDSVGRVDSSRVSYVVDETVARPYATFVFGGRPGCLLNDGQADLPSCVDKVVITGRSADLADISHGTVTTREPVRDLPMIEPGLRSAF